VGGLPFILSVGGAGGGSSERKSWKGKEMQWQKFREACQENDVTVRVVP